MAKKQPKQKMSKGKLDALVGKPKIVGTVPGLGCPHCGWAGYKMQDRFEHIRDQHPGEYSGVPEDVAQLQRVRPDVDWDTSIDVFRDRRK